MRPVAARVEVRGSRGAAMSVTGAWRIVEMDLWDGEAIDLLGPGYIQFGADRTGHFRFIAVEGWMDCHSGQRDGRPCVECSWEGNDESNPRQRPRLGGAGGGRVAAWPHLLPPW
jgi:hypothetical protein